MQKLKIEDLLEYYHYKSLRDNDKRASIILEEFQDTIGVYYDFVSSDSEPVALEYETIKHISELNSLRYKYGVDSLYYKILHELIKLFHYNFIMDIREAVTKIGNFKEGTSDADLIKEILLSPVIDDISSKRDSFKIFSEEYGVFEFMRFSEVFKDNESLMKYMNENKTAGRCHMNVEALSQIFPNFYTITSLLDSYYEGYYYHSYTYDKCENSVIDANSKIVCSKDDYDRLMCPQEIMCIKNSRLSKYFKKIDRYSRNTYEGSNVFGVALMMQLKKMNRKDRKILAREINNS